MDKVRNHMCDAGYQNKERFILIQCFNDVTAINYIAENHIVKTLDPFSPLITLASDVKHVEFYFVHTELGLKNTRGTAIIILFRRPDGKTWTSIMKSLNVLNLPTYLCQLLFNCHFVFRSQCAEFFFRLFLHGGKFESFKGKKLSSWMFKYFNQVS